MDRALARAVSHLRNCTGGEVRASANMVDKRNNKYRTAILLALFALGLFLFTLYNGLK